MTTTTPRRRDDAQDWDTARDAVRDHAETLAAMSSHSDLFTWARDHGLDTGSLFAKFKTELRKQLHINYDELRAATHAERLTALADRAAEATAVRLYAAGDAEVDSFAVCGADGADPWYGDFHARDGVEDQLDADRAAAAKAVYLAGQARDLAGLDVIALDLVVCNHEVSAGDLVRDMLRHQVHVRLEVIDDAEANPALEVCRLPGFRGWREVSLTDLISPPAGERAAGDGAEHS